ncbi:MAG: class B sortase [Eggerthellaceae bacterium]|nr:class B sortase [Eggerthellaceae bacterium]
MPNHSQDNQAILHQEASGAAAAYSYAAEKPKKRNIWRVVFWVSLIAFLVAMGALAYIGWGYFSSDQGYKEVASSAFKVVDTADTGTSSAPDESNLTLADMEVDWEYLRSINPAVVAWVYMPGTRINYPVVQGKDNDEYLWVDFNLKSSRNGSIFLDSENNPAFTDMNNVLYGHHMNDGSMFACISNDFVNNEEFNKHRTIYVLTPQLNYKCTTFAVVVTDGWDLLVQTTFKDPEDRASYIQDKIDRSVVQPSEGMPTAANIKQVFTFSTCDYTRDNGRAVLFSYTADTAVPKSVPAEEVEQFEVSSEDLEALEQGVSTADE